MFGNVSGNWVELSRSTGLSCTDNSFTSSSFEYTGRPRVADDDAKNAMLPASGTQIQVEYADICYDDSQRILVLSNANFEGCGGDVSATVSADFV